MERVSKGVGACIVCLRHRQTVVFKKAWQEHADNAVCSVYLPTDELITTKKVCKDGVQISCRALPTKVLTLSWICFCVRWM